MNVVICTGCGKQVPKDEAYEYPSPHGRTYLCEDCALPKEDEQ